jgi:L-serine dehydratase
MLLNWRSNPTQYAKVPLDKVVDTMWQTAKDMNNKWKLQRADSAAVNMSDC